MVAGADELYIYSTGHKMLTQYKVSLEDVVGYRVLDSDEEQEFLNAVTAQVAEAMERARLLEQTQGALTETERLFEASLHINEANSVQELIEAMVKGGSIAAIDRIVLVTFEHDA